MKLYPFPKPRPHLRRRATSKGRAEIYWDHSTHVIRWMGRNALRRLAVYHDSHQPLATVEELEEWILDHSRKARDYFQPSKLDRMAYSAAVFALEAWDPEVLEAKRRRARNGGLKTAALRKTNPSMRTRGAEFTVAMLEALEPGLSIAQQAVALGCSTATVSRLRAELKAKERAAWDAELATLFPDYAEPDPVSNPETKAPETVPRSWVDDFDAEAFEAAEIAESLARANAENPNWMLEGIEL